jgi:hypothetical protein
MTSFIKWLRENKDASAEERRNVAMNIFSCTEEEFLKTVIEVYLNENEVLNKISRGLEILKVQGNYKES